MFKQNLRLFTLTEFTRGLIFHLAVWVLFERQFISAGQLVFLEGLLLASQLVLELPTGAFADLVGKRWSVALGYSINALAYGIFSFATTFQMFFISIVLIGLAEAFISGAREALLYDTLKQSNQTEKFVVINAKLGMIFQTTLAVAIIVGGVIGNINLQIPIWLYAAAQFLTGIISLFFIEPRVDSEKFTLHRYRRQILTGFAEIRKNEYILTLSIFYLFFGAISWSCIYAFSYLVMVDLGFSPGELGWTAGVTRLINSLILFTLVSRGLHLYKKQIFIWFPIILTLALIPGIWFTKWVSVPFIAITMLASTVRWVVLAKFTNDEFDSKNRATAISTLSMGIGIIYVVLMWGSIPLISWWGNSTIVYTMLGALSVVTILPLGFVLARRLPR